MKPDYQKSFKKDVARLKPSVHKQLAERLFLFEHDPFHPLLRNHALKGKYLGLRSINITGDYRAIYQPAGADVAVFLYLNTHSNLYE